MTDLAKRASEATLASEAKLVGGALCLDLVNTIGWRGRVGDHERLGSFEDLVDWARHAGALTPAEARALKRQAATRRREAADALGRARLLREAIHRMIARLRHGETPGPADLATLNAELARAPARVSLVAEGARVRWRAPAGDRPDRVLSGLAWSAADLIQSRRVERVKVCMGEGCGWLFVDESRNMSRRWCSMELCGNRAKAKRHYERSRDRQ
jgi:predicted RNA-binding Zn ribbon-like protein